MRAHWFLPVALFFACSDNSGSSSPGPDGGGGTTTTPAPGTLPGPPGSPPPAAADAPSQCRNLVRLYCQRAIFCESSDAGTPAQQQADCEAAAGEALRCSSATAMGATYTQCTTELPNMECSKFATQTALPDSCKGVIQYPPEQDSGPPPLPGGGKPNAVVGRKSSLGTFGTYLGCVCNSSDPESIASPVGPYGSGSKFSQNSIWNRYGTYGSDYSSQSACNKYASDPPVVIDSTGKILGKLTRNQYAAGAITDPDVVALLNQNVCVN